MLCVLPREARAQNPFTIDYSTTYLIQEDGNAAVNQTITLTNNTSETYAPSYELFLEGRDPEDIQAVEKEEIIPTSTRKQDNQTIIVVSFPKALVGKNKSRTFSIKYGLQGLATKNGQVWEVAIPKVVTPDTIDSKTLILYVPKSLGLPAYISPEPQKRDSTDNHYIFTFEKEDLLKAGVVAAFGKFQVFSFDLTYHLENPTSHLAEMKIALPPDTAFQHVFYQEISPKPKNISLDIDGNWIAIYQLGGKEKLEVKALGNVQVFADPQSMRPQLAPVGDNQLKEAKYWEVNDPEIISLGKEFKTPRNIYDFVVALLSYDYSLVNQTTARVGAKNALLSPLTSVCREFTDLFISLSRSAGIPAREVNGFAYTENPQIQPLSLVADVLHAWPEYWDDAKRLWIPVDPTWGKTTGGIDFFDKFDLNHITFAIHGANSESPLPAGAYKIED
ncbi:MAG: transglutaminase family protein, partial [bacterium]|nr:transglutaminase family protein [bacterium]